MIRNLGHITQPLKVIRLGDDTRLLVSPWAAVGTDVLGLGASAALFFSTKNFWLRALAVAAGAWMATALGTEVAKLFVGPEKRAQLDGLEAVPTLARCSGCRMVVSLTGREHFGARCLDCGDVYCRACGLDHIEASIAAAR